jgi:hydrogenase maturation protease
MARILVVGYGNPMRSDDGIGWQLAVELFRTNHSPDVEVLPCHQLTPELAPAVSRADTVIFIDCSRGGTPGEIRCREVRLEATPSSLTHFVTPAVLLSMSSELFGACPRAYLLSIEGENFALGESWSTVVATRIPDLKVILNRIVHEALNSEPIAC